MAPKSKLLTAGDKPKRKPYIPRNPLTTQGKIAKAIALKEKKLKNQPREAPPGSELDVSAPPTKKSKAKSFAPPDEVDAMAEELKKRQLAKARGEKKEVWNIRKKPITTQQKIAAALAVKKAKGGVVADEIPVNKKGRREVPGLMRILKMQDKDFVPMEGGVSLSWKDIKTAEEKRKEKREEERLGSCIFRASLRARKWRERYGVREFAVKKDESTAKEAEPAHAGWFTNLPDEVRTRIWKLVVVDDKSCIWPTSPTGRKQPDIAMTCKQIRQEVLPLYYGLNTFGVSLQKEPLPTEQVKMVQKKALTGLAAVHKWASTIGNEDVAWLSMIQNWAFEYQDPASAWGGGGAYEDDESFVISMRIKSVNQEHPERQEGLEEAVPEEVAQVPASTADVEVHLEASCFMRGWSDCGKCRVQEPPIELAAAVRWMLDAGFSANSLYKFVGELRGMLPKLNRAKCLRSG